MTPIGRGQRELIIGDRKTGKTAIAIDTIINQKEQRRHLRLRRHRPEGVDVGRRGREAPRDTGAMDYTIVVVGRRQRPGPAAVHRPLRRRAMAEYFMYEQGSATLCVYDDLSKQAAAYRQLSLLLRRPPGREAYPGDVFYCHTRLLERSAKLRRRVRRSCPRTRRRQPTARSRQAPAGLTRRREASGRIDGVYHRPHGKHKAEARPRTLPDKATRSSRLPDSRRLADGAADHRDAGRRSVGLHPDERDLDHRRPDLPRSPTCSSPACGRPSTSASASPAWAATPRSRR